MKLALLFLLLAGCPSGDCPPPPRMTCPDGFVLVSIDTRKGCCDGTHRCLYWMECRPDPQPSAEAKETK